MATPKRGSAVFSETDGVVELGCSKSGDQSQPRRHFELVVDKFGGKAPIYADRGGSEIWRAVGVVIEKVVVLVLEKSIDAGLNIVFRDVSA